MSKIIRKLPIILIVSLFVSCKNSNTVPQVPDFLSITFRQFLKKFKTVSLPFVYRNVQFIENFELDTMDELDINTSDTLFLKSDYGNGIKCFAMLPDTSKFFSLIYFFPADSYYPVLATYDKTGKLIDQTKLIVNGYGADCGLEYYSATGMVFNNLLIFCADTVKWEYFCDSAGEPIPNSAVIWTKTKTGIIADNGSLNITENNQKEIKYIRK